MYAIIVSGGKQYRVTEGQVLKLEKLDVEAGQKFVFEQVLMVSDDDNLQIGTPHVSGASVEAEVIEHGRGKKIQIIKFKRRKSYLRRQGHRQSYTEVKITAIKVAHAKQAA